jgi:hypothetical protein
MIKAGTALTNILGNSGIVRYAKYKFSFCGKTYWHSL